jgi:hypothetical protein
MRPLGRIVAASDGGGKEFDASPQLKIMKHRNTATINCVWPVFSSCLLDRLFSSWVADGCDTFDADL